MYQFRRNLLHSGHPYFDTIATSRKLLQQALRHRLFTSIMDPTTHTPAHTDTHTDTHYTVTMTHHDHHHHHHHNPGHHHHQHHDAHYLLNPTFQPVPVYGTTPQPILVPRRRRVNGLETWCGCVLMLIVLTVIVLYLGPLLCFMMTEGTSEPAICHVF